MEKFETDPIKLTAEGTSGHIELKIPWDSDLEDWEHAFRLILAWATFGNDTIDEMFNHKEYSEEPLEDEE